MTGVTVGQGVHPGDEVRVAVDGASALTGVVRDIFEDAVKQYATELLNEASRREVADRGDSSPVIQYTTSQVAVAETVVRSKGVTPPRRSRWIIVAKVAIYLLAAVIGVGGNLMVQSEPWFLTSTGWLVTFTFAVTAGLFLVITTEITEFKKERG